MLAEVSLWLLCGGCGEMRGEAGDKLGGCCNIQLSDGDEMDREVGGRGDCQIEIFIGA